MFNLDDCIACITSRSAKKLAECFEKRLNYYNITKAQWIALYYISINQTITQRQLADKMAVKEPTVVRLLDKMETLGWVVRVNGKADKRIKLLELTEKGQKIQSDMLVVAEKFRDDVTSGISPQELNNYKTTLDKMLGNIKNG